MGVWGLFLDERFFRGGGGGYCGVIITIIIIIIIIVTTMMMVMIIIIIIIGRLPESGRTAVALHAFERLRINHHV